MPLKELMRSKKPRLSAEEPWSLVNFGEEGALSVLGLLACNGEQVGREGRPGGRFQTDPLLRPASGQR